MALTTSIAFLSLGININSAQAITTTYSEVAGTPIPLGLNPIAVVVNPETKKVYVANFGSSNMSVIDSVANTSITVSLGGASKPSAVAVNPRTNMIYITEYVTGKVFVINGQTDTVVGTIVLSKFNRPSAIAVNPDTNMIYVTNFSSNDFTVLNGATNTTVNGLPAIGSQPYAIAIDQITRRLYIVNSLSGTLSVIQESVSPVFSPTMLPPGTTGFEYSFTLRTTESFPIAEYSSKDLPSWLKLDPKTGLISGTPQRSGTYNFTVMAANLTH